jgi:transcriptional regulator with XRE-family HTH domain
LFNPKAWNSHPIKTLLDQEVSKLDFTEQIRKLRKDRGLTLDGLAGLSGLTKGYLSRVENRQLSPSINTLVKIAQGLGVPLGELFNEGKPDRPLFIVRSNERKLIINDQYHYGIIFESLAFGKSKKIMQPFTVTLHPNSEDQDALFDHAGEEFIYVLEGDIEFFYGKERYPLKSGDALYFDANVPHRAIPGSGTLARILVVITDPNRGTMMGI